MLKKICVSLLPVLMACLGSAACAQQFQAAQAPSPSPSSVSSAPLSNGAVIDDNAAGWIWDHMSSCDSVDSSIASAHAGGPGSSATYIFSGTGVTIYGVSSRSVIVGNTVHRTGLLRVTIDGATMGDFPEYTPGQSPNAPVFAIRNLTDSNHSLILEPVGGWSGVSSIRIERVLTKVTSAAGSGKYFENFASGNASNWTTYGGNWWVNGHWFFVDGGQGSKAVLNGSRYDNLDFEANIAVNGGGNSGLIFRVSAPSTGSDSYNGYYVGLDSANQTVAIGKASQNWTSITSQPYIVLQNQSYQLRVVATGPNITVYVNGIYVVSCYDTTYTTGAIGLRTFNEASAFTNIAAKPVSSD